MVRWAAWGTRVDVRFNDTISIQIQTCIDMLEVQTTASVSMWSRLPTNQLFIPSPLRLCRWLWVISVVLMPPADVDCSPNHGQRKLLDSISTRLHVYLRPHCRYLAGTAFQARGSSRRTPSARTSARPARARPLTATFQFSGGT